MIATAITSCKHNETKICESKGMMRVDRLKGFKRNREINDLTDTD